MIRSAHFRAALLVLASVIAVPGVLSAQVGAPRRGGAADSRTDSATAADVRTVPINPHDTVTKMRLVCADGTRPVRRDRHACDRHGGTRATVYTHTTNSANLQPTTGASAAAMDSAAGRPTQNASTRTDSSMAAADSLAAASAATPPKAPPAKGDDECGNDKADSSRQQKRGCDQQGRTGRPPQ